MRSLRLTLAYDGTDYAGWQVQRNQSTIQGVLESAFTKVTGERTRMVASGRTDAGVHALGQVVSCETENLLPNATLARALNANLPRDIRVLRIRDAPRGFHAIRDAVTKCYRYSLHDGNQPDVFQRGYSWFIRGQLETRAMHRSARPLIGTHDFSAFEAAGSARDTSVRTVSALTVSVTNTRQLATNHTCDRMISVEIESNGFLYNMVRNIVGTLVEVGTGRHQEDWPGRVLEAKDRGRAGMTAPAHGLTLVKVDYPF